MNSKLILDKAYLKRIIVPIVWELLFVGSCFVCPHRYIIYTNFIFYIGIIIYFYMLGDFRFYKIIENLKSGKKFWINVLVTALAMTLAFILSVYIGSLFPNVDDGTIGLARDSWIELIIFAISTIICPPLAEELFYRQAFVRFDNKNVIVITSLISMFLYALEHSIGVLGIIEMMIVAIPLTISYIKTRNVYVNITAHFLVNFIGNGASVIFAAIALLR